MYLLISILFHGFYYCDPRSDPSLIPSIRLNTQTGFFYGYSPQLGSQVRIKVARDHLNFELIDNVLGTNAMLFSPRIRNGFLLFSWELEDVKRKSITSVQFKVKPDFYPMLLVQPNFPEDASGSKLHVNFSPEILKALLDGLKATQFVQRKRYGFLWLRSKWVPPQGV